MATGTTRYVVRAGDCTASIGRQFGLPWKTIWDHPANAELKRLREDPGVLQPGDVVEVPERQRRYEQARTGTSARFVLTLPPVELRLRLQASGVARSGKDYVLELEDGSLREGKTDGDGCVIEQVPASARRVTVRMEIPGMGKEEYVVKLGHLDPISDVRGLQQRLTNVGFQCSVTGELDGDTGHALALFQEQEGLEVSGAPDDATRSRLLEVHGA